MKAEELTAKHCAPCEGGVAALTPQQAKTMLAAVPKWELSADGKKIARKWKMKDFVSSLALFDKVGKLAEEEQHHPDLHLTGYKNVAVELSTHAIGGLSENDFIVAAKIDRLAP
jgi:4a-hydroxytetrahydrobiopterin dehydratase